MTDRKIINDQIVIAVGGTLVNPTTGSQMIAKAPLPPTRSDANRMMVVPGTLEKDEEVTFNLALWDETDVGAGMGRDPLGMPAAMEQIITIVVSCLKDSEGELEVFPAETEGWPAIGTHTTANEGALAAKGCLVKYQAGELGFELNQLANNRITLRARGGKVDFHLLVMGRG